MKKVLTILLVAVLLISLSSTAVFASIGRGMGNSNGQQQRIGQSQELCQQPIRQSRFKVCTVDDCIIRGIHEHDGVYFRCSYFGTGLRCGFGVGRGVGEHGRGMGRGNGLRDGSCRRR